MHIDLCMFLVHVRPVKHNHQKMHSGLSGYERDTVTTIPDSFLSGNFNLVPTWGTNATLQLPFMVIDLRKRKKND